MQNELLKNETGRSMVEMLGVLAVMGVLSVAGIAGYNNAMNRHRANELLYEASKRAVIVAGQAMLGRQNFSIAEFGSQKVVGADLNVVPVDAEQFAITISKMDKAVCQHVLNSIGTSTQVRRMTLMDTPTLKINSCEADGASYALVYNNDLSTMARAGDFNNDQTGASCGEAGFEWCENLNRCLASGESCPCSPGYYAGESGCIPCPAGTYTSESGATTCEECPAGTYASGEGNTTCKKCPAGTYTSESGATTYEACPAGTYASGEGNTTCEKCPAGTYAKGVGNAYCFPCADRKVPNADIGATGCVCQEGNYTNGYRCTPCPQGEYASEKGSSQCTTCPSGTSTSGEGSASCTPCPEGEFSNQASTWLCRPCPSGSYNIGIGNTKCICPEGEIWYETGCFSEGADEPCFTADTLITLANGTQKRADQITYDDELLVWNFDEGHFDKAKPLWIKQPQVAEKYILLKFSDGSVLKFVNNHRIFNREAGKFTYALTEETPNGTTTMNSKGEWVTLVEQRVVQEQVVYHNIITYYHINCFAGNILTSCRFNNLYPIQDLKFVKDNRPLVGYEEYAELPRKWYDGLRLAEQPKGVNRGNDVPHGASIIEHIKHVYIANAQ